VVSRLRKDAHLCDLPLVRRRPGQRGPLPTYGKHRLNLAKRAGQRRGWQRVACVQYGTPVVKKVKTFLATWRPAGGVIRVVLVREATGWLAFFCTQPQATAVQVLEAMADRGAIEQTFKDLKEVWGAGQQQLRNVQANVGAYHLNLWAHTLVELWAWDRAEDELVNRAASPWDSEWRRPSHADRRKALLRETLRAEIQAVASGPDQAAQLKALAERLLLLAA
jgi:hypothetical protein